MSEPILKLPLRIEDGIEILDADGRFRVEVILINGLSLEEAQSIGASHAREIVRKVNAFDALLSACREMLTEIRAYQGEGENEEGSSVKEMCDTLKSAIAVAEKELT